METPGFIESGKGSYVIIFSLNERAVYALLADIIKGIRTKTFVPLSLRIDRDMKKEARHLLNYA